MLVNNRQVSYLIHFLCFLIFNHEINNSLQSEAICRSLNLSKLRMPSVVKTTLLEHTYISSKN